MISKFKINRKILVCCKCNLFSNNLIELPCYHFICTDCAHLFKFKFYFHCKQIKYLSKNYSNNCTNLDKLKEKLFNYLQSNLNDYIESFKENFLNYYIKNDQVDYDLIEKYFKCQKCLNLFEQNKKYFYLVCNHLICNECFKESKCPICQEFMQEEIDFIQTDFLIYFYKQIRNFLKQRQEKILRNISHFFSNFDDLVINLRHNIINDNYYENLVDSQRHDLIILKAEEELNKKRHELITDLNRHCQTNISIQFQENKQNQAAIQIIGCLKNAISITKRVKYLNLYPIYTYFNCQEKNITKPFIETTAFNWLRLYPKPDLLIPFSINKVLSFYLDKSIRPIMYEFKISNPIIDLDLIDEKFTLNSKLQYCRLNKKFDRIALFYEIKYDKEYVLKIFDSSNFKFISSKNFTCFFQNILFDENNNIFAWSPDSCPYMFHYENDLKDLVKNFNLKENVLEKFFSLDDLNSKFFVLHNEKMIGIVCKETCDLKFRIFLEDLEEQDDLERNNMHQQRMANYQSRYKIEYLNLKFVKNELLIVTTWSKIFVYEATNFNLITKNHIYSIQNNNWYLPNRLYMTKDEFIAFFDSSSSFLTFI